MASLSHMTFPFVQICPDNIVVGLSTGIGAILSTLYPSGYLFAKLRLFSKTCEKTKITKNRSIMVVSDHNRPVQCNGVALFR